MWKLICISTFVTSFAFADFNGQWQGTGILTDGSGNHENCNLQIEMEQTPNSFSVKKSVFQCPSHTIKNRPSPPLEIRDGELWFGTTRLGKIFENSIHTELRGADGRFQSYDLQIIPEGRLVYKDHVEWTNSYKTEMNGELVKLP